MPVTENDVQSGNIESSGGFNISELAIKRPVSTIMMIITLIVLGITSYGKLSIELFPNVSFPIVAVTTTYPGASSQEVETLISKPIEDAVSSINGLEHVSSTSGSGFSTVIIQFKLEKDIKDAGNEVREKVALVRSLMPEGVDEPVIARVDPDAAPIINYVIGGDFPVQKLTDFVRDRIKPLLEQVDGVGAINISGAQEREVQVKLDPARLKSYGISALQVSERIRSENLNFPSGTIKTTKNEISLRTTNAFTTADQVANIPVKIGGGQTVLLQDLGTVVDGVKEIRNRAWLNGKAALVLSVQKQSGTNTIEIVKNLNKELEKMKAILPSGINIGVSFDTSKFIMQSKDSSIDELVVGGLLAVLVIFIFLRTIRGTIIAACAIPTSIISTYTLLYAMNFSINMMTLLALSLVVGILVDDAVVDLENIFRHMQLGERPYEAAIKATNEIGLAVVATTFSIVAVFVPIAFMSGMIGQFFRQFGLTVSFAVLMSLLVARTLTPTLAAYILRAKDASHEDAGEPKGIALTYRHILEWALRHRVWVVIFTILAFVGSMPIIGLIPKGFVPKNDRDEFSISVQMPSGSSLEQTSKVLMEISKRISVEKLIKEQLILAGNSRGKTDTGTINVTLLTKPEGRKDTVFMVQDRLQKLIENIPGALISFKEMRAIDDGSGNYALNLSLRGENLDELQRIADHLVEKLHTLPFVTLATTSTGTPSTEIHISIDPNRAAAMGVSAATISSVLSTATFGNIASQLHLASNNVDIRVSLNEESRYDIAKLRGLAIPTATGSTVPLDAIAKVEFQSGPTTINRYDRQRQIMVQANTISGISLGDLTSPMEAELKKMNLPPNIKYNFQGEAERMQEAFGNLLTALFMAIIFIYIILASQFEHFVHPFTIMMALPLSFIGAFLGLFILNKELGMMSMIGIVMLMGLVTKNSILLVDYTITMQKQGLPRKEALLKAGPVRLRPILMTTIAMIAGMTPVALQLTPGSEGRSPMAAAVIGGVITSTMLSLVVIPVFYTLMDDLVNFLGRITGIKLGKERNVQLYLDRAAPAEFPEGDVATNYLDKPGD
jgi:HAE1 family hydrophobic/amphiphilic exporter-1